MICKLNDPDLPQSERNRISQIFVELTKRKAYRHCLAPGQCKGFVVGGHVIPRSWLRRISNHEGEVRVFSKLPVNPFNPYPEEGPWFPTVEHFNNAFVGAFTCQEHEKMFFPVDTLEPDLGDSKTLNLLVYRPIIAALWRQRLLLQSAQAALAEVPESESFLAMVRLQRQRLIGLEHYKQETERCLHPERCRKCDGGKCKAIGHRVFHLSGDPAIAASDFSDGIRTRINPEFGLVDNIVNWGITVLPLDKGHKAILHHFIEEEDIIEPMSKRLSGLHGRKLQREISYRMLKSFENIAIDPMRWKQLGKNRRRAIREVFASEMPDIGFGSIDTVAKWERERFRRGIPIPNPNQINLFNPNKR